METVDNIDLNGKVVLITGCNSGIGKETARVLAIRGAKVYMLCRNEKKAITAREDIIKSIQESDNKEFDGNNIVVMYIDLSSLLSVRRFVGKYLAMNQRIDYLINNAAIMTIPEFRASMDGYELQFAVNYLGHFYLTILLTPLLLKIGDCRVINLASNAAKQGPKIDNEENNFITDGIFRKDGPSEQEYGKWKNYGLSKICIILFAREYNRRYEKYGIISVSVHPGTIPTAINRHSGFVVQFFMSASSALQKTIPQGAATTVRCVSLKNDEIKGGHYYQDCNEANDALRNDIKPGKWGKKVVDTKVMKTKEVEKKEEVIKKEEKKEESGMDEGYKKCAEYRLWEWSELLIKEKGFNLDMDGFEDEEKERQIQEQKALSEFLIKQKGYNLDMDGFEQEEKEENDPIRDVMVITTTSKKSNTASSSSTKVIDEKTEEMTLNLVQQISKLEVDNQQKTFQIVEYTKTNQELLSKIKSMENRVSALMEEKDKMKNAISTLEHEKKELEIENIDLKKENKKLKLQNVNVKDFRNWNYEQIISWIISLDQQIYGQYEQVLSQTLHEENVNGQCLHVVEISDIKRWGIVDFMHSKTLMKHIQTLVANRNDNIEGVDAPTAYI